MFETMGQWFSEFFTNLANQFVSNEDGTTPLLGRILLAVFIVLVAWFLIRFICFVLRKIFKINKTNNLDKSAKSFIVSVVKTLLWIFVAFLVLNVLGVDITSFAGILSAITVALGLALQDVIATFAAGVLILNQKLFISGDYVEISNAYGKVEGTVVKVSIMTTQLNTFDNQMVFVPNGNIIKSNLTNFSKEKLRRIVYTVNVAYNSDIELVKKVLNEIVDGEPRITKEKLPFIHVNALKEYSVEVVLKLWTDIADYWDVYNSLSEKILIAFAKNNIEIPSSTSFIIKKTQE